MEISVTFFPTEKYKSHIIHAVQNALMDLGDMSMPRNGKQSLEIQCAIAEVSPEVEVQISALWDTTFVPINVNKDFVMDSKHMQEWNKI